MAGTDPFAALGVGSLIGGIGSFASGVETNLGNATTNLENNLSSLGSGLENAKNFIENPSLSSAEKLFEGGSGTSQAGSQATFNLTAGLGQIFVNIVFIIIGFILIMAGTRSTPMMKVIVNSAKAAVSE